MKLVIGYLNYAERWWWPDVYLFTGNSTVRKDGGVVMGRGAARQCRDIWPNLARNLGSQLEKDSEASLLWVDVNQYQRLGWFKVKNHWQESADLDLIAKSAGELAKEAVWYAHSTFHMNFPGIGNGRLAMKDVMPLLETLPDNVWLYK